MSAQSTPIGMDLSPAAEARNDMAMQCMDRLQHFAYRAIHTRGLRNDQFFVICVEVDSRWRDLVAQLMPGADWQQYRDAGQAPIARGAVPIRVAVSIAEQCPETIPALMTLQQPLPPQKANCVVLNDGGCTVLEIDVIEQAN